VMPRPPLPRRHLSRPDSIAEPHASSA
jgi:hypothetical protein